MKSGAPQKNCEKNDKSLAMGGNLWYNERYSITNCTEMKNEVLDDLGEHA